jgi:hypothetical protein
VTSASVAGPSTLTGTGEYKTLTTVSLSPTGYGTAYQSINGFGSEQRDAGYPPL